MTHNVEIASSINIHIHIFNQVRHYTLI